MQSEMERRSWPWKKKSSGKGGADKTILALNSAGALAGSPDDQDNAKKPKYVQISAELYSHLTGLESQVETYEDQVKTLEDHVAELNEKLSAAETEMTNKENMVKQHSKVAEEAVSGWEKAEAEALTLKNHLESVTLLKLTAEDRASHLDGALKECMRQIRNLKEEHEQKLHEVVLMKTKECDKIKLELEAKMDKLDQELLRSEADNAAMSRALQERSSMLINISEAKSQAEAEIELLKSNIESCEREISSLKYELHVVTKELEIRNEEKNMSVRSAEVANKQHLEGAKKIAKLEVECQRLRGLVKKKLPGPAALAQMKLEVESLGHDYGENRVRRSPSKRPSPHPFQVPEFSLDSYRKFHKENDFLTERLLAMEEETKMLKEALAKRNSELQASRNIFAKTASKLQSLEYQLEAKNQDKSPSKSILQMPAEGFFSQNTGSPPSFTSMSEDGNDDVGSCAGSWATLVIKKENNVEKSVESESENQLELMDDFLEMEKLANVSNESNAASSGSDVSKDKNSVIANQDTLVEEPSNPPFYSNGELLETFPQSDVSSQLLMKLRSRISMLFESMPKDADVEKILEDIRCAVQETHDNLHQHSTGCGSQACPKGAEVVAEDKEISLPKDNKSVVEMVHTVDQELAVAVSWIREFVLVLGNEAMAVEGTCSNGDGLSHKIQKLSTSFDDVINSKIHLLDFVLDLSHVLNKASELHFNVLGYKNSEGDNSSSDCIDKVALPENMVVPNGCAHFSESTSDPDIPHEGSSIPTFESNAASWKCSLEEFEQLKLEKDNLVLELGRSSENLESAKTQLQETEQKLVEVKSQLASAQNSNSLAETQLKCMAESYKSLETRAEELQIQVNLLQAKMESLDNELQEERRNHQDVLAKCKDLEDQLQRNESCAVTDVDEKTNQEKDFAAAAEKLAECQETIFLLSKQLNTMRPPTELTGSPHSKRTQRRDGSMEEEPTSTGLELDCSNSQKLGSESPDKYNAPFSPSKSTEAISPLRSPISSKNPKHRPTKSGSSPSSSTPTPEKQSRGISRFFSSK
ncbi:hypothetical protein Vadar_028678 [Vaccinium darrowii]|uniref:Uncharacterized protein n=1 Tax=Vaccinium darrowii TaxID=229202 RepID=A0ACB7Y2V9_9ERIC|nr:hypothetical protein Vadar_028678 [Vaccinium darrowii]